MVKNTCRRGELDMHRMMAPKSHGAVWCRRKYDEPHGGVIPTATRMSESDCSDGAAAALLNTRMNKNGANQPPSGRAQRVEHLQVREID